MHDSEEEKEKNSVDTPRPGVSLDDLVELLTADPANVFKLPQARKVDIIHATSEPTILLEYPDDLLPRLFCFCCGILREFASLTEEAIDSDHDTWIASLFPALKALFVLASYRMLRGIGTDDGPFVSPILEHWEELYHGLKILYTASRTRDSRFRTNVFTLAVVSHISKALNVIFRNNTIRSNFQNDTDLRKFVWMLWFSGGIPEAGDLDNPSSLAVMFLSTRGGSLKTSSSVMLPICMAICDEFGGKDAVAEIAFMSLYNTMMSDDKSLFEKPLTQQLSLLLLLADSAIDPTDQILRRILELDGVAKLIEGVINMVNVARDDVFQETTSDMLVSLIALIVHWATESHVYLEQAIRGGLLRVFLVLRGVGSEIPERIQEACSALLKNISHYLPYYSIIHALSDELRNLTEEDEACMREEDEIGDTWKAMERDVLRSYVMKRAFDTGAQSLPNCCNNCAKIEDKKAFLRCKDCSRVSYCSKECLGIDWYEGRHFESCRKQQDDKGGNNISFLSFLADQYVRPAYKDHLAGITYPAEDAIFVLNAVEMSVPISMSIYSKEAAKEGLHERRKWSSDSYRVVDQRCVSPHTKRKRESATKIYIQTMHREGRRRCVVRYLPFDMERKQFESVSRPMFFKQESDDFLYEIMTDVSVKFPGAELKKSWILGSRYGGHVHLFDEVDAYFQTKCVTGA
ncbi:hypothetical protein SCHPADRAFT_740620 [Schizopora paradoxa]|uniref:MYND-type domain-containing protein n=1 Tax=Schizopora paradoxa TaxID=27342 RepID=A0A0H2QZP5_9AGAM|nr:hypothetical protein SCHPADRAFT_740620 [Schizopora paradoxa]